jgi:UDP-3-O-[3-hydroxymyristoyl] glucosamine N-acyltransferase
LKTIKIGSQAFIGFYSRIGPGVKIGDGVVIPAVTDLYTDWVIQSQNDLKEFLNAKA